MTNAVAGVVPVGLIQIGPRPVRLTSTETAERLRARLELE
jgi:branched-subunit amino acid aminotransferase/4-amino-4-deoxychorismate lyase